MTQSMITGRDLTTLGPVEFDTLQAQVEDFYATVLNRQTAAADALHRANGERGRVRTWGTEWATLITDTIAQIEADPTRTVKGRIGVTAGDVLAEYRAAADQASATSGELVNMLTEYESRPWPRYVMSQGHNAHIHSGSTCSTLHRGRERTRLTWLVELSGQPIEACIDKFQATMCTVCYPDAPVIVVADPNACGGTIVEGTRRKAGQRRQGWGYVDTFAGDCTCGKVGVMVKADGKPAKHKPVNPPAAAPVEAPAPAAAPARVVAAESKPRREVVTARVDEPAAQGDAQGDAQGVEVDGGDVFDCSTCGRTARVIAGGAGYEHLEPAPHVNSIHVPTRHADPVAVIFDDPKRYPLSSGASFTLHAAGCGDVTRARTRNERGVHTFPSARAARELMVHDDLGDLDAAPCLAKAGIPDAQVGGGYVGPLDPSAPAPAVEAPAPTVDELGQVAHEVAMGKKGKTLARFREIMRAAGYEGRAGGHIFEVRGGDLGDYHVCQGWQALALEVSRIGGGISATGVIRKVAQAGQPVHFRLDPLSAVRCAAPFGDGTRLTTVEADVTCPGCAPDAPVVDADGLVVKALDDAVISDDLRMIFIGRVRAPGCGHYMAASERRAGLTTCERCPTARELDEAPEWPRDAVERAQAGRKYPGDDIRIAFTGVAYPCDLVTADLPAARARLGRDLGNTGLVAEMDDEKVCEIVTRRDKDYHQDVIRVADRKSGRLGQITNEYDEGRGNTLYVEVTWADSGYHDHVSASSLELREWFPMPGSWGWRFALCVDCADTAVCLSSAGVAGRQQTRPRCARHGLEGDVSLWRAKHLTSWNGRPPAAGAALAAAGNGTHPAPCGFPDVIPCICTSSSTDDEPEADELCLENGHDEADAAGACRRCGGDVDQDDEPAGDLMARYSRQSYTLAVGPEGAADGDLEWLDAGGRADRDRVLFGAGYVRVEEWRDDELSGWGWARVRPVGPGGDVEPADQGDGDQGEAAAVADAVERQGDEVLTEVMQAAGEPVGEHAQGVDVPAQRGEAPWSSRLAAAVIATHREALKQLLRADGFVPAVEPGTGRGEQLVHGGAGVIVMVDEGGTTITYPDANVGDGEYGEGVAWVRLAFGADYGAIRDTAVGLVAVVGGTAPAVTASSAQVEHLLQLVTHYGEAATAGGDPRQGIESMAACKRIAGSRFAEVRAALLELVGPAAPAGPVDDETPAERDQAAHETAEALLEVARGRGLVADQAAGPVWPAGAVEAVYLDHLGEPIGGHVPEDAQLEIEGRRYAVPNRSLKGGIIADHRIAVALRWAGYVPATGSHGGSMTPAGMMVVRAPWGGLVDEIRSQVEEFLETRPRGVLWQEIDIVIGDAGKHLPMPLRELLAELYAADVILCSALPNDESATWYPIGVPCDDCEADGKNCRPHKLYVQRLRDGH